MKIVSDVFQHPIFGRTVELNILGEQKICNFDCTYCSRGPSLIRISRLKHDAVFTPVEEIISAIGKTLGAGAQSGDAIETVLISGNGEPTLHPLFPNFAKALIERRSELSSTTTSHGKTTRIVCLTNGDRLDDRDIVDALNLFDESLVKIDVGTERAFKKINRPISRSSLEKIILGARALKSLTIQTMVTGGDVSLIHPNQLDEWIEVIAMMNPKAVYLQRPLAPCADPTVKFPTDDEIHRVSHWLERKLKIKARVAFDSAA